MATPSGETPELRVAFRTGEQNALERLFHLYVDEVGVLVRRGFIIDRGRQGRVLGVLNPADQRDIAQEVFARAFSERARASYDVNQPFRPYLLRIAKNLMIDRLRRLGRELSASEISDELDLDALIALDDAPTPSAEERLDQQRLQAATREFLDGLSADERSFCQLRFQEGLPQETLAERLSITRRRVRTLEARLRKGLQRFLRKRGLHQLVATGATS